MTGCTMDILLYWALNVSAAFFLSAAHNALYFAVNIRTPMLHFLHHMFTFLFLASFVLLRLIPCPRLPFRHFLAPVGTQFLLTVLNGRIHSQHRNGSLYLLRLCDFITTLTVMQWNKDKERKTNLVLIVAAIAASLSWLEFGIIEYDLLALFLAPLTAALQGIHYMMLQKAKASCAGHDDQFIVHFTGFSCVVLLIPALLSLRHESEELATAWESIDYALIGLSFLFMICFKYSELWLVLHLPLPDWMASEHLKFWMASIGQWFLQNMAHATVFSLAGKLITIPALWVYWGRRLPSTSSSMSPLT